MEEFRLSVERAEHTEGLHCGRRKTRGFGTAAKYSDSKALFNRQFRDFRKSRLSERKGITLVEFRPEDLSIEGILNKLPSWVPLRTINKDSKYVQTVEKHCQNYIERTFRARSLSR
jgi:hypothetical protein